MRKHQHLISRQVKKNAFYRQCYDALLTSHTPFLLKYANQKRNNLIFTLISSRKTFASLK